MRALIFAMTLMVLTGDAMAQSSSPQDLDRLKRLLDDRLGSGQRTRSIAKPTDKPLKQDDFYVVRPDGTIRQPNDKRSSVDGPLGRLLYAASGLIGFPALAEDGGLVLAQADGRAQSAPQIKRDSYVIQLKDDLTSEQLDDAIDTLRNKYGLEITSHNNTLGILYVSPAGGGARRGLSAGSRQEPRTLGAALEPQIIKDLRREPFVDAAYVNFVVGPKTLPRKSETKVQAGSSTFAWHWRNGETDDGNWGLKAIRMPPVWTILERARKAEPDRPRPRLVFLDSGFGTHGHLTYNEVLGGMPPNPVFANCEFSHGTHVAGIAGALWGKGRGTDGIVPDAKVDAIPVGSDLVVVGVDAGVLQPVNQRAVLFTGAVDSLVEFTDTSVLKPGEKRVINVSLGYNWSTVGFEFGKDPEQDDNVKAHIVATSRTVQRLATRYRDTALIVAAAGNDSQGVVPPYSAEWATPFGFAGMHNAINFQQSKNVIVVEAFGRDGQRAQFSNGGGHVSAPGVDIMSTLAGVNDAYGTCSGTSQAAPHVAALAAILFELDPAKTPAEIADIIKSSAVPGGPNSAPRIDALAAVLKLSKDNLKYLVDLNGDGKFDEADLEIFKTQLAVITDANVNGSTIALDLNGDGIVDDDERCWPLINFNGLGKVAISEADARNIDGVMRTDLQVLEAVWSNPNKPFKTALAEIGLDQIVAQWTSSNPLVASVGAPAAAAKKASCN